MAVDGDFPESWIDRPELVPPGARPAASPGARARCQAQFDRFAGREDARLIVNTLWHYVRNLPRYAAAEGVYWALSCLPGTRPPRLTAISLRTMESIVVREAVGGVPDGYMMVGAQALYGRFGSWDLFRKEFPGLDLDLGDLEAGLDQVCVQGDLPSLRAAVVDGRVAYAIRALTHEVCGIGSTPHTWNHCPQLADLVLADRPPAVA